MDQPRLNQRLVGCAFLLLAACSGSPSPLLLPTATRPSTSARTSAQGTEAVSEFVIQGAIGANSAPFSITAGPDGAMWFTEQASNAIGRIDQNGIIRQFPLPTYNAQPEGIAPGPGGALYFAEHGGSTYGTHVGRITVHGRITEWNDSNAMPQGVAAFSAGSVWFTDGCGGLTVLDARGKVSQYPLDGIPGETPAIVRAPDGALWFAEDGTDRIGRIDASENITIYHGLMYQKKYNDLPYSVTVGPDRNLWWTATMSNVIWAMNLKGRIVHRFAIPTAGSQPWGITAGRDGALWFTETLGNKVGRVTTGGVFTEYALPTSGAKPQGIAADAKGTIWFVESGANKIGRIGPPV